MNRKTLSLLISLSAIILGIVIRFTIQGWFFPLTVVSTIILIIYIVFFNLLIHSIIEKLNRIQYLIFLISNIFLLGIFIFQFDAGDSKTYSALGYIFNLKRESEEIILSISPIMILSCTTTFLGFNFYLIRSLQNQEILVNRTFNKGLIIFSLIIFLGALFFTISFSGQLI